MLLSFRQGIVRYEASGFLSVSATHVSLVVTNTPTTITLAHGNKDYLHVEQESVPNAWGPISTGVDQWLYWDINTFTATRTFGITLLAPIVSPTPPPTPLVDQHWFDTAASIMKVWTGTHWSEKIRVFVCMLANGAVPLSVSINSPLFDGTQVGSEGSTFAGQILIDAATRKALRLPNGKFITTEDTLAVQTISQSDVKFAAMVLEGVAQQAMAAYTVVKFSDFGKIIHADQFIAGTSTPFGLIQQGVVVGATTTVIVEGTITNPDWDWSAAGVNAKVYCTSTGALTTLEQYPQQPPVAVVVDRHTILLGAPIVNIQGSGAVVDNTKVAKSGDTMTGPLVLDANPTLSLHAATKQYVDDSVVDPGGFNRMVQYNNSGQFTGTDHLMLYIPEGPNQITSLSIGSSSDPWNIGTIIQPGGMGAITLQGGGRQDLNAGGVVVQGGNLTTTGDVVPGPGEFYAGDVTIFGGFADGIYGNAGDVWIWGGSGSASNGDVHIRGGTLQDISGTSITHGGHVYIDGGHVQGASSNVDAGNIHIISGHAEGSGTSGYINFQTDGMVRLVITRDGAWGLTDAENPGTSGQVITSQGPGTPPIWSSPAAIAPTITLSGHVTGSGTTAINTTLSDTTVTPGSYTLTNLTVDSTGRITSASSGSAVTSFNGSPGDITFGSSQIITALGYTPVNKNGDTLTGLLTLSGDPTNTLHAATKQYVDDKAKTQPVIFITGTLTLSTTHAGAWNRVSSTNDVTIFIPTNATTPFPIGTKIEGVQVSTGLVTLSPSGGVTLNYPTSYTPTTRAAFSAWGIIKVGTDEWDMTGDLKAL